MSVVINYRLQGTVVAHCVNGALFILWFCVFFSITPSLHEIQECSNLF